MRYHIWLVIVRHQRGKALIGIRVLIVRRFAWRGIEVIGHASIERRSTDWLFIRSPS